MAEETDELFVFNGVDAARGGYLLPPMAPERVLALARGEQPDAEAREEAQSLHVTAQIQHFGPREGVDPRDLAASGWGVIFAHDEDPAVREALAPLLALRRQQAGDRYREMAGAQGYRPGERKPKFLHRQGAASSGPADPDRVPYYLLIVGDPEKIPFEFQSQLDLQYAVGRLHFDTPAEYDQYARSVVAAERGLVALPRRLALFGPRNPDDQATKLSAEGLLGGLERYVRSRMSDWTLDSRVGERGSKGELAALLGGADTPAVLFTASHGAGFPAGDPRQRGHQGALVCQEWGGPRNWPDPLPQDMYFAGDDLTRDALLAGLISFHFACYGGGTPKFDAFFHRAGGAPAPIAPAAFVADLPRRMLGHPRGGALAAIAHVERAWGCSFYSARVGHQIAVFESFMERLLTGHPVGSALDYFGSKYGELSSDLAILLEELEYGNKTILPIEVANMWTANNDARNYILLGDPAVRVPLAAAPSPRVDVLAVTTATHAGQVSSEKSHVSEDTSSQSTSPVPGDTPSSPASPVPGDTPPPLVSSASRDTSPPSASPVPGDTPPPSVSSAWQDTQPARPPAEPAPPAADHAALRAEVARALQQLVERLRAHVDATAGPLEVSTHAGLEPGAAPTSASLRASTRIEADGRTIQIFVAPGVDPDLARAHQDAVHAARQHRTVALKAGVDAVARLLAALEGR